jgi:hypothetical protein
MLEALLVELNAFDEKTFDELKLLNAVLRPEVEQILPNGFV